MNSLMSVFCLVDNMYWLIIGASTSYCMSARAIRRILASSPRAAGPRASANITTYSPRTHAITSLLHDDVIIVGANISYWHCGQCHILYIGIAVPLNL